MLTQKGGNSKGKTKCMLGKQPSNVKQHTAKMTTGERDRTKGDMKRTKMTVAHSAILYVTQVDKDV